MFRNFFRRKSAPQARIIVAHLNVRSQPVQRGEFFEDPLDAVLADEGMGSVVGGGTELADDIGVVACDLEISVVNDTPETIGRIVSVLERLGAPKGSEMRLEGRAPVPFGRMEGLAVFLNGTDLPADVYRNSDVNETLTGLSNAMAGIGEIRGHWEGSRETALYFYGAHFAEMKAAAMAYAAGDPLCADCRYEQIA